MRRLRVLVISFILISSSMFIVLSTPNQIKEDWEDRGLEWHFDNLTPDDRKKIRQAMDFAIPRNEIINWYSGFGAPIISPIGRNVIGVNENSTDTRDYNITKSLELLTEVFGKTYNEIVENDTFTMKSFFKMELLAACSGTCPFGWMARLVNQSFAKIGIDVNIKWIPSYGSMWWDERAIGFDSTHNGYDAMFFLHIMPFNPDYHELYDNRSFPPGKNYYWIENQEIRDIWEKIINSTDKKERIEALNEYQIWHLENLPASIIFQPTIPYALNSNLKGYDPHLRYNFWNWSKSTPDTNDSIVYCEYGGLHVDPYFFWNPRGVLFSSTAFFYNCFRALAEVRGSYNITYPVPVIAESWNHSSDGLTWTVKLKKGISFWDGSNLTADDVFYSYNLGLSSESEFPKKNELISILGNSPGNIKILDDYTVQFVLSRFHPNIESDLLNFPIIAKDKRMKIPFSSEEYPIGIGPYKVHTIASNGHIWQINLTKSEKYNGTLMGYDPQAEGGGIYFQSPFIENVSIIEMVELDEEEAIEGLESGLFDVINGLILEHGALGPTSNLIKINESDWGKIVVSFDSLYYELGYNHYNPIWGMNPHDPRIMYPEDYRSPIEFFLESYHNQIFVIFIFIGILTLLITINRFKKS